MSVCKLLGAVFVVGMVALLASGCSRPLAAAGEPLAGARALEASSSEETMPRTISVSGVGTASGRPDIAYVEFGVQAINPDADKAVTENSDRMTAVMGALQELKIEDKDIQTINYSMWLEEVRDKDGNLTGESRYHVVNQLRVKVRDLTKVGQVLQKALKAGANNVGSVSFSVADPSALQKQARDAAIGNVRAKAEQLAAGFGAKVGKVHQVSEYGGEPVPAPNLNVKAERLAAGYGGGEVPVSGGELSVNVQIQVTFDIAE
jgi:hypothetical protein